MFSCSASSRHWSKHITHSCPSGTSTQSALNTQIVIAHTIAITVHNTGQQADSSLLPPSRVLIYNFYHKNTTQTRPQKKEHVHQVLNLLLLCSRVLFCSFTEQHTQHRERTSKHKHFTVSSTSTQFLSTILIYSEQFPRTIRQ